jgi:hypothetical protein
MVAACGGNVESLSFPNPPTSVPALVSPPTLPGNLASAEEVAVPGSTTTTPPRIGPGSATLNGTVLGPAGPVPGATVEADRFVGDQVSVARTTTAADGSWTIGRLLGGRFRVRAWQSPSLALTSPQVIFLDGSQTLSMSLQLAAYTGPNVATDMSPSAPEVGQVADLLVKVTNPVVGSDGVVRNPPNPSVPVTLVNGPGWQVDNANPVNTDADGNALFQITCLTAGSQPLSATVGAGPTVPLALAACLPAPVPTTTTVTVSPCPTIAPPPTVPGESTTTSSTLAAGVCA